MILVGDNPGTTEKEHSRYIIGNQNPKFRGQLNALFGFSSDTSVILNKTYLYSNVTSKLNKYSGYTYNDSPLLQSSLEYMANFVYALHHLLRKPVYIFGYSHYQIKSFFRCLNRRYTGDASLDEIYILMHPSYNNFSNQIKGGGISLGSFTSRPISLSYKVLAGSGGVL